MRRRRLKDAEEWDARGGRGSVLERFLEGPRKDGTPSTSGGPWLPGGSGAQRIGEKERGVGRRRSRKEEEKEEERGEAGAGAVRIGGEGGEDDFFFWETAAH